jgi:hypothetical protein
VLVALGELEASVGLVEDLEALVGLVVSEA